MAIYLLGSSQDLRKSRGRQAQLFVVILMFVATSAKAICDMIYYQSQLIQATEAFVYDQVDLDKLYNHWFGLNVAGSILQRVNVRQLPFIFCPSIS